jgi:adenylate cyclase
MIEIERKFLVNTTEFISQSTKNYRIKQGYLSSIPERTVRVRTKGSKAFITIKGKSSSSGMSRYEWEKEITTIEADQLLLLCEAGVIEKTRYEIQHQNHLIEIDVFEGVNKGLILAEIELQSENETLDIPNWLGIEVTNNPKYYNAYLSNYPYSTWL